VTAWRRRGMFTQVRQIPRGAGPSGRSCPSPAGCLMQLVRHARRRQPGDCDSRQPGDDAGMTGARQPSSCCRCSDGIAGGGGGGGRLSSIVDACAASSARGRCRMPRCSWWKSLCTRVYLISLNLASFVSFPLSFCTVERLKVRLSPGPFLPSFFCFLVPWTRVA